MRMLCTAVIALGASGVVFAGITVDHSTVSVIGCGPNQSCSVGGASGGTGAVNSGGAAQGGRSSFPDAPGGAATVSGNLVLKAGRKTGSGMVETGHYGGPPCTNNC